MTAKEALHSYGELRAQFLRRVGFIPLAAVSDEGAAEAAGRLLTIGDKLAHGKPEPVDIPIACIAASQLLGRFDQEIKNEAGGKNRIGNPEQAQSIRNQLVGNVEKSKIMMLTALLYVYDPKFGANKAMEVFGELCDRYPQISLRERNPDQPASPDGDELPLGVA